ncbi:single-stranded DNA-binding protein [Eubacterium sp.]
MINMVALMGRLTFEPELRTTPNGTSIIRFQVACDRNYQKDSQNRQADFIDCVAWRQTAEFISRYFHKGSMIAVEGSIQTSNYTDKDGNKRKQIEVLANNVSFCGGKSENGSQGTQGAQNEQYTQSGMDIDYDNADFEEIVDDDDLPF